MATAQSPFSASKDDPDEVYETVREAINFGKENRLELIEAAEAFAKSTNDAKLKNRLLRCRSVNSIISGDPVSALAYANSAWSDAQRENLEIGEQIHALNMLGQAKSSNGDVLGALRCYQQASELAKNSGSPKEIFVSGLMESNLYIKLQRLDQALEVMKWMEDYYHLYEDPAHRLVYAHNYADCLVAKERYQEVVRFIEQRVGFENTKGDVLRSSISLIYLLSFLESKLEWDAASRGTFTSHVEAIEATLKEQSASRALFISWTFVGRVWYLLGQYDQAFEATSQARKMTEAFEEKPLVVNLLEIEARIENKRGNFEIAISKMEQLLEAEKALRDESVLKQIEILREEHQSALKTAEIARLNLENNLQQRQIKIHKQRVIVSVLIAILLLVISTLAFFLLRNQSKHLKIEQLRSEEALKVNRQLRQAEENKDYFLAVASHELRNPLNGIIGILSLLKRDIAEKEIVSMVDLMDESANAMLEQINEILEYSKAEAGKLQIVEKEFEIRMLASSVMNLWRGKAESSNSKLKMTIANDVAQSMTGDPFRIRQVLSNLIGNAIKFTPEGTITLKIHQDNSACIFEIADTGIGLSEQEIETLFEPFQQANRDTAQKFGGTGLGLSICKSLADAMKGEIRVLSQKGKGSTFIFRVPFKATS